MVDFTVAIPTYNGAERLPQLIDKLRSQTGTEGFSWDILIVDNNSSDNTKEIVLSYQTGKTTGEDTINNLPAVRYAFEKRQGAAFARVQAMETADTDWVGFLDDDIIPASDWVAAAYEFGQSHPQAAAYGGQIHGQFDVEPPENFNRIKSFLALRERGNQPHRYNPDTLNLPPSASWVVQRKAWKENVSNKPSLGGRANGSMTQGDDYEPLLKMHKAGWEIWYAPEMHVSHHIPEARIQRSYLTRLSWGCGICICALRMINTPLWRRPFLWVKLILSNGRRALLHWLKYRNQLSTDLVAACEMQFFLASVSSPFYYLKTSLFSPKH